MKQILLNFPKQFSQGYEITKDFVSPYHGIKNVLVVGMGGSALPGDFLKMYVEKDNIKVSVARDYRLRKPVSSDTVVFVISYSGNTEETIEALEQLIQTKANIVVLASGGKLVELAHTNNLPLILVPQGMQPRCATGYFFSIMVAVLEKMNVVSNKQNEIISLAEKLTTVIDHVYLQNLAKRIQGKIPLVYGASDFLFVVRNIKIKFNENSKTQAFFNVFPELNHNEMVGFTNLVMTPFFLIFQKPNDYERVIKRMHIFAQLMKEKHLETEIILLRGKTMLEWIFEASYMGDWLSYYLALAYGIDPEPVVMVEDFKKKMVA
jgi:glucose/mannose-6-phosphate isomerase